MDPVREGEIERTWSRIEDWMRSNAPEALGVLRPGLPEATVRGVEQSLALELPDSFRRSIGQHDGQEWRSPTLIEAGILMPLEEMVVRSRENERHGVDEAGGDGERWWRRGWFPFVSRDGDYLTLALGSSGEGEVWCFLHDDEPMHSVVAPDFDTWLERWADELEAGVFELDRAPGAGLIRRSGKTSRLWPPD